MGLITDPLNEAGKDMINKADEVIAEEKRKAKQKKEENTPSE